MERIAPEVIGEYDGAGGVLSVVGGTEQTAKHRTEAHDMEVIAVYYAGGDFAGSAETDDGEVNLGKGADLRNGL